MTEQNSSPPGNHGQTVPAKIAADAEAIYEQHFKADIEAKHDTGFVAIDVLEKESYFGETAEDALMTAREKAPHGVFHLIRIGSPDTVSSSYGWNDATDISWAL